MILSYHPCFEANNNRLCAGRKPGTDDLAAIQEADAVILPQGCHESLYTLARSHCKHVFPNFDARFNYKGKIGQIQLFQKINADHPKTEIYPNMDSFSVCYGSSQKKPVFGFPFVFKFDWGGDGTHVYLIQSFEQFSKVLQAAKNYEYSGRQGFILQEYIPANNRSLRVVIIGETVLSYWRVQAEGNQFLSNVSKGAIIDYDAEPDLQKTAVESVKYFCRLTGINLAGFDILFSSKARIIRPIFLEINYFFGRQGIGGSEKFYGILIQEIMKWIESIGLFLHQ